MQVSKAHMLKNSKDPEIKLLQLEKSKREYKGKGWKAGPELDTLESTIKWNKMCSGQTTKFGLGYIKKKTSRSNEE
jgi:hypothetical protein